jgi:hypothetical protein
MAVTIKAYGHAGMHLPAGDVAWTSDTIKLALATSSYAVSQGNDEFFSAVTNEIAASGGYTSGGFTLTGATLTYDATTRESRFDADDFSVSALTPSSPFRYGIIYDATPGSSATDILLAYINFGADQDPAGLPFAIQWASTGVFYIQAS